MTFTGNRGDVRKSNENLETEMFFRQMLWISSLSNLFKNLKVKTDSRSNISNCATAMIATTQITHVRNGCVCCAKSIETNILSGIWNIMSWWFYHRYWIPDISCLINPAKFCFKVVAREGSWVLNSETFIMKLQTILRGSCGSEICLFLFGYWQRVPSGHLKWLFLAFTSKIIPWNVLRRSIVV